MNVQEAWDMGYRGQGVVVSILDDGIEKDHPDLKNNYVSTAHFSHVTQMTFGSRGTDVTVIIGHTGSVSIRL